jgi:hypothetical protein
MYDSLDQSTLSQSCHGVSATHVTTPSSWHPILALLIIGVLPSSPSILLSRFHQVSVLLPTHYRFTKVSSSTKKFVSEFRRFLRPPRNLVRIAEQRPYPHRKLEQVAKLELLRFLLPNIQKLFVSIPLQERSSPQPPPTPCSSHFGTPRNLPPRTTLTE